MVTTAQLTRDFHIGIIIKMVLYDIAIEARQPTKAAFEILIPIDLLAKMNFART
jgi:hypothetical protein